MSFYSSNCLQFHYDVYNNVVYRELDFMKWVGYRIGDDGSLWSRWKRGKGAGKSRGVWVLGTTWSRRKPIRDMCGYLRYMIHRSTKPLTSGVHRLVLFAFIGSCPEGMECRHLNGKRADNRLENLAWGTDKENRLDQVVHGTSTDGDRSGNAKLSKEDIPLIHQKYAGGLTTTEIAREYGVHPEIIRSVLRGLTYKRYQPSSPTKLRPGGQHGHRHHASKLTQEDVCNIRKAYLSGESVRSIARRYPQVHKVTVGNIVYRRTYRD
jgi:hypothetical protein